MNMLEAVVKWHECSYADPDRCRDCDDYMLVDPRMEEEKGVGPGPKGQRTLCSLLDDLNNQIMRKTGDSRLEE